MCARVCIYNIILCIGTNAAAHVSGQIEALLTHALVGAGRVETEVLTAVRRRHTLVSVCNTQTDRLTQTASGQTHSGG